MLDIILVNFLFCFSKVDCVIFHFIYLQEKRARPTKDAVWAEGEGDYKTKRSRYEVSGQRSGSWP